MSDHTPPVLVPGETCWRVEAAQRVAFLIDNQAYYAALSEALKSARHSILILGWAFDPRTRLAPDGYEGPNDRDEIGRVLIELTTARPGLDVRLLIWRSTMSINGSHDFLPHRARRSFWGTPVQFRLDSSAPMGACHHQKVVVIDDRLAFCGGGDVVTNRWDTPAHLDGDPRRILPRRARHPPRHEVTAMVDGAAAAALGELFRERWKTAARVAMPPAGQATNEIWPELVAPIIKNGNLAIARTYPAWKGRPEIDEIRRLTVACIAEAEHVIYLESQYFTSELVTDALAARLTEPKGPEVILIVAGHAPSWFDRLTMDTIRNVMVRRLIDADRFGRFRAYWPVTASGEPIIVHSKVSIFDDTIARVGSANLNNRSGGFDTECELAVPGVTDDDRRAIVDFRDELASHFLGVTAAEFQEAKASHRSVGAAMEALNNRKRLRPILPTKASRLRAFFASFHIGDPSGVRDSWRLNRRR